MTITHEGLTAIGELLAKLAEQDEEMKQAMAELDAVAKEAPAIHERRVQSQVNLLIALFEFMGEEARARFIEWLCENEEKKEQQG